MIALFTDFGTTDAYVAQMKGAILGLNPHTPILDLAHDITPFDIRQAAYVLEQAVRYFPARTIFVAVVDPGVGTSRRPVLLRTRAEKFYVGPDNGVFSRIIVRQGLEAAHVLEESAYFLAPDVSSTFHGRDIFAPVAAHLSLGVSPSRFGPRVDDLYVIPQRQPQWLVDGICGEVQHIDRFGNIVSNITPDFLAAVTSGQQLQISLAGATHLLPFCHTYGETPQDTLLCLLNSDAVFEIAVSHGNASSRLGVQVGDRIVLRP
ncbi:Adenosyl-chloride synthase [Candidatus Entotheonellaceae bacterium PAL068K]